MLRYGCTRLEIGVQSVYEDVARDTNRFVALLYGVVGLAGTAHRPPARPPAALGVRPRYAGGGRVHPVGIP